MIPHPSLREELGTRASGVYGNSCGPGLTYKTGKSSSQANSAFYLAARHGIALRGPSW